MAERPRFGLAALLLAVLIWASTFVLVKDVLGQIGPFALAVARFAVALVVLVPFARRRGFRLRMAVRGRFLRFGATGVAAYFGLQNLGLVYTTAGSASLINALIPAATAVLAAVLLGERPGPRQTLGIVLSVIGVGLVVRSGLDLGDTLALVGNLLILGSALSWGLYTVQGRRRAGEVPAIVLSTGSIASGTLLLLPFAIGELVVQGPPALRPDGIAVIAYLGVMASAATFVLWNSALRSVSASAAGAGTNLVPVVGLGLAVLAGEPVSGLQLFGGLLATSAVFLAQGTPLPDEIPPLTAPLDPGD